MGAISFTMRFSLFVFMLHLNLFMSFICSVRGQDIQSATVSSSASTTSGSTAASSQGAWWEKKWDVVVVGSGPAGIIGNFYNYPFLLRYPTGRVAARFLVYDRCTTFYGRANKI